MTRHLPLVDLLQHAGDNRARAGLLLTLSDAMLLPYQSQLALVCAVNQFQAGQDFLAYRVAALCSQRDAHGLLPPSIAKELEAWRVTMSRYAAGEGDVAE